MDDKFKVSENRTKEIYYLSNKKFHPCWYFVVFMLHWHYKYGIQIGNFNRILTYLQRPLAGENKAIIMFTLLWHTTVPQCRLLFIISRYENLHRMEFRGNIFLTHQFELIHHIIFVLNFCRINSLLAESLKNFFWVTFSYLCAPQKT